MKELPYRAPRWWPYKDEFPEWRFWRGQNGLLYARLPGTDPLVIVHAQDPAGLRAQMVQLLSGE